MTKANSAIIPSFDNMLIRILVFLFLIILLSGCDKDYESELIIVNKTENHITIRYQIDYNPSYNPDSVYREIIYPYSEKIIFNDLNSRGMKCEEVRSTQEKIYFLNILSITNSNNDSCSKAFNACSEWVFSTKKREEKNDLITYHFVLSENDFKH